MKVSDNLLKSISFYYTKMSPAQFIIKSDIILFKNHEMILKSLQIADMITKLTKSATTEAEKKFYNQESSVEEFNKALAKERKTNPGPATIKELIIGTGIVYPPCLKYFYNALTKGELTTIDLPKLAESIFITHKKLAKLLSESGGSATQVTIDEIQTDLTILNNKAKELYSKIEDTTTDVQAANKSISKIKETLTNSMQKLQTDTTNTQDITDIQDNLKEFYQEMNENINNKIKFALEDQVNTITKAVTEAITKQTNHENTQALQSHTTQAVEDNIKSMLSSIKTNLETDISNVTTSSTSKKELDSIFKKIQDMTKATNEIAKNLNITKIIEDLQNLSDEIYKIHTNNKERADLMDSSIGNIRSSLNIPIKYEEEEEEQYAEYNEYDNYE